MDSSTYQRNSVASKSIARNVQRFWRSTESDVGQVPYLGTILLRFTPQQNNKDHDMGNQKSGDNDCRDEVGSAEGPIVGVAQTLSNGV